MGGDEGRISLETQGQMSPSLELGANLGWIANEESGVVVRQAARWEPEGHITLAFSKTGTRSDQMLFGKVDSATQSRTG